MDGFLNKQGGGGHGASRFKWGRTNWLSRYFVLEGTTLKYFEPAFDASGAPTGAPRGAVDVGGALVVDVDAEGGAARKDGRALLFAVRRRDESELLLQAETAAAKALWLDALGAASRGDVGWREFGRRKPLDADADYAALGLAAAGDGKGRGLKR